MNIQDALKETRKATRFDNSDYFAQLDATCVLRWVDRASKEYKATVMMGLIVDDCWQPYHEVKEISPEKGELWGHAKWNKCFVVTDGSNLAMQTPKGCQKFTINYEHSWEDFKNIIHNKNGWTRLYPPVEDDSVERIKIEGVSFQVFGPVGHARDEYLMIHGPGIMSKDLQNKPSMKMILEISKEG